MTDQTTSAADIQKPDCPWPRDIFTPLSKDEQTILSVAILDSGEEDGIKAPCDRFVAMQRRAGWEEAMQSEYIRTLEKEHREMRKELEENAMTECQDPVDGCEETCFACSAKHVLSSITIR